MKRLVLLVVVALGMSATSFAGEKVEGKDIVYVFIAGENSPKETWDNMIPDIHGQAREYERCARRALRQEHAITLRALGNTLCFIISQDWYFARRWKNTV